MNLSCQGVKILTAGQLIELGRLVDVSSPILLQMVAGGGDVDPDDALRFFEIDVRLAAPGNEEVGAIVDSATERLSAAFPQLFSAVG